MNLSLFVTGVTHWVVTSVITSFGVNIEWTARDSTRWVVNKLHSILELELSEIYSSTNEISSLHIYRWSELFTRFLESIIVFANIIIGHSSDQNKTFFSNFQLSKVYLNKSEFYRDYFHTMFVFSQFFPIIFCSRFVGHLTKENEMKRWFYTKEPFWAPRSEPLIVFLVEFAF